MENITVPRWFLEVVEDTLRIQNNINLELEKGTGETCQDRNVKQSLNGIRKLLKGEELTGMERHEKLQTYLPSNLDEAAEEYAIQGHENHTNVNYINTYIEGKRLGFITGAKWMARQGESYDATISADKTIPVLSMKDVSGIGLDYGDNVIVQIRKK